MAAGGFTPQVNPTADQHHVCDLFPLSWIWCRNTRGLCPLNAILPYLHMSKPLDWVVRRHAYLQNANDTEVLHRLQLVEHGYMLGLNNSRLNPAVALSSVSQPPPPPPPPPPQQQQPGSALQHHHPALSLLPTLWLCPCSPTIWLYPCCPTLWLCPSSTTIQLEYYYPRPFGSAPLARPSSSNTTPRPFGSAPLARPSSSNTTPGLFARPSGSAPRPPLFGSAPPAQPSGSAPPTQPPAPVDAESSASVPPAPVDISILDDDDDMYEA
ncbi:hypothetical protein BKA70DRAFT_1441130 [Coprinopsis sp. MPI-PUGE-AT-0042]|nr:hypothetical protein BKA70DRAFT_1441130 [Coprinopsis sp. MPI-PUGE-AT-0042]